MLLDITPDQSMVDEGVAREVINRIQKLRKKVRTHDDISSLIPLLSVFNVLNERGAFPRLKGN